MMKLPIKKKYFDKIKSGEKHFEYRDAHITFICEETGEELRKEIKDVYIIYGANEAYPDVLEDDKSVVFILEKKVRKIDVPSILD